MRTHGLLVALCVVVALGFAGCSSDDDNDVVDLGRTQAAEAALTDALNSFIIPLMVDFDIPFPATVSPGVSRGGCTTVPCGAGTGEICLVSGTEYEGVFSACEYNGALISGTYEYIDNSTSANINFIAFDVDGIGLDGNVDISDDGACETIVFNSLVLSKAGDTVTLDGSIDDCGAAFPEGGPFNVTAPTTVGDFQFTLSLTGTAAITVSVIDLSTGETFASCTADLLAGTASCS